jgi:exodeoxyribonuclease V alpha subunit
LNPRLLAPDEQLTGEVVGIIDLDGEDGDAAARSVGAAVVELAPDRDVDGGPGVRCSGPLTNLSEGERITLIGRWYEHPTLGRAFDAVSYEQIVAEPFAGLRAFLDCELFDPVSQRARTRVLMTFGSATPRVIEREPGQLVLEAGLAADEAGRLHEVWRNMRSLAEWVQFVECASWPLEAVRGAHARFGAESISIAKADPYRLLEADQLRFSHVDRLARHLGVSRSDPRRLRAGATATVATAMRRNGHQYLPLRACITATARPLRVDHLLAAEGVAAAVSAGELAIDRVAGAEVISTPAALNAERDLGAGIVRLLADDSPPWESRGRDVELATELTADQAEAVRAVFRHPVTVVAGGPGSGRDRVALEIVHAAETANLTVALCAPTLRAAELARQRLGRPVIPIGGLVETRPGTGEGSAYGGVTEPLPQDLIVVVGASSCNTELAARLVAAARDGANLAWVGDPDLRPSTGTGNVMRDLIGSMAIKIVRLNDRHPQAYGSRLLGFSREVLSGDVGTLRGADGDLFLAEEPDPAAVVARVVQAVTERIPAYFDVTEGQIQVLAPGHGGPAGVAALNAGLERAGASGHAMSVHQAGDGEWPVVVLVVDDTHLAVLSRTLLYAAVTRAQRALIVVGQAATLRSAVRTQRPDDRRTALAWRLGTAVRTFAADGWLAGARRGVAPLEAEPR